MPPSSKSQNIEISLPNQVGYERIAMACSESFAIMLGLSPERIEDLKTIVAEAAINAVQHGNRERRNASVAVSLNFKDDALHVAVTDSGGGITELPPNPDINRIIENLDPATGFGTFMIKQLADEVEFNASHLPSGVYVARHGGWNSCCRISL